MKTTTRLLGSLFLFSWFLTVQSATVTWDGGGDGVSWGDRFNWSGDAVPGAADDVLLDVPGTNLTIVVTGQRTVLSLVNRETLWINGRSGPGDARLSLNTASTNEGIIRLESSNLGYADTLNVAGTLVNAPGGVVQINPGSGGSRTLNASVLNQGTITVSSNTALSCPGAGKTFRQEAGSLNADGWFTWADGRFDFVGGTISGSAYVRNGTLDVSETAGSSTLRASGNSMLLGNRSPVAAVWVQGNSAYNDATLTTAEGAVNAGRIHLESANLGYASVLNLGGSNLVNLPAGVIDASSGSGGPRSISGFLVNKGLVDAGTYYLAPVYELFQVCLGVGCKLIGYNLVSLCPKTPNWAFAVRVFRSAFPEPRLFWSIPAVR